MSLKKSIFSGLLGLGVLAAGWSQPALAVGSCSWAAFNGDSQYFPIVVSDRSEDGRKAPDGGPCGKMVTVAGAQTPAIDRGLCFGYVSCDGLPAVPVSCQRAAGCRFTNEGATACAQAYANANLPEAAK